jgi:murein DD-endopeptidase MepM/ murein hydrolase activator NlpD
MGQDKHFDGLTIAAVGVIVLMGFGLLRDAGVFSAGANRALFAGSTGPMQLKTTKEESGIEVENARAKSVIAADQIDADTIAAPYDHFIVSQGLHGADYGHMAIDISAGKGAMIKSPINGTVTNLYIDDWGNPSLMIENDHYAVELLHGLFTVKIGDKVTIGQPIGKESNQGETFDGLGRLCAGRDCGYHTHINVYDKQLGRNVNPLKLFSN